MKPTVHILVTVRKPELLDAALLVFRTLRTGFPTAEVWVWGNGLGTFHERIFAEAAGAVQGRFKNLAATAHDAWIETLLHETTAPFWICDTDIVFWDPVEAWFDPQFNAGTSDVLYAGRHEPEFHEEWTDTRHMERLHTALMWFNPSPLRGAMRAWMGKIPSPWRNVADFPFIRQHFVPQAGQLTMFYDSCAGLFQAMPGTRFTEAQDQAFEHLHCATYADVIRLAGVNLQEAHQAIYADHRRARGIRGEQNKYYRRRALARPAKARRN